MLFPAAVSQRLVCSMSVVSYVMRSSAVVESLLLLRNVHSTSRHRLESDEKEGSARIFPRERRADGQWRQQGQQN